MPTHHTRLTEPGQLTLIELQGDLFSDSFSQPVLFCRADSVYKRLGCDVYDFDRDALTWRGGVPVIAHPPCRSWGKLAYFSNPRPGEREAAVWAVDQVRRFGGVLEHPERSTLWEACSMPLPGQGFDYFGGWTLPVAQYWFGHEAMKLTWLYIVGVKPSDIPDFPLVLGDSPKVVAPGRGSRGRRPSISKSAREHTPLDFAIWLLDLVSLVRKDVAGTATSGVSMLVTPTLCAMGGSKPTFELF